MVKDNYMLDKEIFQEKYGTKFRQIHPESFLDSVSKEEREIYKDCEILTGKNINSEFNTFNNYAVANPDKPRNTIKAKLQNHFKKFLDQAITSGEMDEVYMKLLSSSKKGDFRCIQYLMDRALGKETETINIKTEEPIEFIINNDKIVKKKKDKE